MIDVADTLRRLGACGDQSDWLDPSWDAPTAWAKCQHPRHMLWLLGEVSADRRVIVAIACDTTETTRVYVPAGEERPRVAIETARRWARGEATLEEVQAARRGAWAAAAAAARSAARARHADIIRAHVSYADLEPLLVARLARVAT